VTQNNQAEAAEVAARLLGPAEPEIGCEECFDGLDCYVEIELAGADADSRFPGMGAHLEGCAACRNDHDSLLALISGHSGCR
jgi:hypothetical protein